MQAIKHSVKPYQVLTQLKNNTTNWVGHINEADDYYAGQTFIAPASGQVADVQVYANMIHRGGGVTLSLHSFNTDNKTWGNHIGSTTIELDKTDNEKWMVFEFENIPVEKDNAYGFRLKSNKALISVGEAAGNRENPPFADGWEWVANSKEEEGHFFSFFSLVFKVEIC